MSYSYYVSPGSSNYSASTSQARNKRTPLEKAVRWVADKSVNTALDTILSRILAGPLYVRISGAVTTGLITSFVIWVIVDNFLPQLISNPTVVIPIAVGALAGAAMGGGRGLLIGAGFGWLVAILAESSASELSKEPAEKHLNPFWVWCVSTTIGGLAGWIAERLFDKVAEKSPILGKILQILVFFAAFAAVAIALLGVGAPYVLWRVLQEWVPDLGRLQILVTAIVLTVVSLPFYLWCYAPESLLSSAFLVRRISGPPRWIRVTLLWLQGLTTALFLTLVAIGPSDGPSFGQIFIVVATIWIAPGAIITAGRSAGWVTGRILDLRWRRRSG